jgi:glycerol kinase
MKDQILVVDQGTTSTRAIVFDRQTRPIAAAQQEFPQHFPRPGWVEHDPEDIWRSTLETVRDTLAKAPQRGAAIAALGLANQRETVVVWNRKTGRPIHNAIVWQDRRTAAECDKLRGEGAEAIVSERAGLLLDPYFSAAKIAWLLDQVAGARAEAERGELAFGTIDTFLIWRLTNGERHVTDATNASRTSLYDIRRGDWDDDLLRLFRVPRAMLPEVLDCAADFGVTAPEHFGAAVPILGVAGDQQAALIGQACFQPGMAKATFGTGAFVLMNVGAEAVPSRHRMLTTVAYQFGGQRAYALEGSIFSAGATVQWLRDGLGIVATAAETGELAAAADPAQRVYLVPAFTGLGAPHWDSAARAALVGLTRGATRKEIARAALESVGFQTRDLVAAMRADAPSGLAAGVVRVDGGMSASDWTMQFLADMLGADVDRPTMLETTALGAAYLAGSRVGLYPSPDEFSRGWRAERRFSPAMATKEREERYRGWREAVARTIEPAPED